MTHTIPSSPQLEGSMRLMKLYSMMSVAQRAELCEFAEQLYDSLPDARTSKNDTDYDPLG